MELTVEQACINYSLVIGFIIFALWLLPQAVGFKPFFWDVYQITKNARSDTNGKFTIEHKSR